jgi:hypothetical protein|tara:strand:- start:371 stop:619 length:249 start_codon:yes stop_codon:yes gene_type:complete
LPFSGGRGIKIIERKIMQYSIHQNYTDRDGISISNSEFIVKEHNRTHTGVRWITIQNTIDEFDTLKKAQEKYPKAKVYLNPI